MNQGIVLGQLLKLLPRREFELLARQFHVGQDFRQTSRWDQCVALITAQVAGHHSLREIDASGQAMRRRLALIDSRPINRSSLSRVNAQQPWQLYERLFHMLLERCQRFQGHRKLPIDRKILSLDSSTILLSLTLFPWARYRFQKGAVKLHVGLDHATWLPEFVCVTEGHWHDHQILAKIEPKAGVVYVFDRGYYDFAWYQRLSAAGSVFVTRPKRTLLCEVLEEHPTAKGSGVRRDQVIRLTGVQGKKHPGPLRRVFYTDPVTGKDLAFLTNNLDWTADTIAAIYKERWQIELFFKWLKQHARIKTFIGTSENALMTQIWVALVTYLMVAFLRLSHRLSSSLTHLLRLLRVALFDRRSLAELIHAPPPARPQKSVSQLELSLA